MKRFLVVLAGLTVLAVVVAEALPAQHPQQSVPSIGVKIVGEDSWSGPTNFLPLVNGYSNTFTSTSGERYGGDGDYAVNASYHVASSSPGHFFVLAHFTITRNGISTDVDRALPVQPYYEPSPIAQEKLKRATWTNLDNQLCAFAYMSDTKMSY